MHPRTRPVSYDGERVLRATRGCCTETATAPGNWLVQHPSTRANSSKPNLPTDAATISSGQTLPAREPTGPTGEAWECAGDGHPRRSSQLSTPSRSDRARSGALRGRQLGWAPDTHENPRTGICRANGGIWVHQWLGTAVCAIPVA